ncbi:helix-turn-helix transcriptional regulator [Oceanispirochaeta crateris]|nr:helix-turn-helix transcriptional regulator [Oceanispirochaeta crateris]
MTIIISVIISSINFSIVCYSSLWKVKSKMDVVDMKLANELREREKELDCLYRLTPLFTSYTGMEEPLLRKISIELSKAMTSPESLVIDLKIVPVTETPQELGESDFIAETMLNKEEKLILHLRFTTNQGRLVLREKHLLKSAVELSVAAIQRLRNEAAIKEKNTTLSELLTRLQKERDKDTEAMQVQIRTLIFPLLNQLSQKIPEHNKALVAMIQSELEGFPNGGKNFSPLLSILTPRELEICGFVAKGIGSKEIADFLGISIETVERHRCTIRKKLDLNGKAVNLQTYLINL